MALHTFARDFTYTYEGQTLTYTVIDETTKTCATKSGSIQKSGNSVSGELIIPPIVNDGINEYTVTAIGVCGFIFCTELTSLEISNTISSIGSEAFAGCSALTSVNLPYALDTIESEAFSGCTALTSITIPASVTSMDASAFNKCSSLKNVIVDESNSAFTSIDGVVFSKDLTNLIYYPAGKEGEYIIPDYVTIIAPSAFADCAQLTFVKISGSVQSIGNRAFFNASNLSKLVLNEGVEEIGNSAFGGTKALKEVSIPSSVKSIGTKAFYIDGNNRIEKVDIADVGTWCNINFADSCANPLYRSTGLFLNGKEATTLSIPENILTINPYAFYSCRNITNISLNDGLQTIGEYAFYNVPLDSVSIPGSVIEIGHFAFQTANKVRLEYGPNLIKTCDDTFLYATEVFCDREMKDLFLAVGRPYLETLIIGNNVKLFPAWVGYSLTSLKTLKLGTSLTTIQANALVNCTSLTEVVFPPSLETIGMRSFSNATSLTNIVLGPNVKTIDEFAFDGCPIENIEITALTPPTASANSFSDYSGKLYVQNKKAANAYSNSEPCWNRFKSAVMIEPTNIQINKASITGKPGETFQLSAKLMPADVTLPHIFWRSTNPAIATVDNNGLVTLRQEESDVMTLAEIADESGPCKIIAESLYANGPIAEVLVNASSSEIDDVISDSDKLGDIDYSAPYEVYNLQGIRVSTSTECLIPGIYIIRQGNNVKKIAIR